MAAHVAILMRPYLRMILDGVKTIESRLSIHPIPPFRKVSPGDRIHFKASSGPYMATAVVDRAEFHEGLTPQRVAELRRRHNQAICGDADYWQRKSGSRYGTLIWLRDVEATSHGPKMPPSRGPAWFILDAPGHPVHETPCVTMLTDGALRNGYVRLGGVKAGPLELLLPDGRTIRTDRTPKGTLRWRGWRRLFAEHDLRAGDQVVFAPRSPGVYHVTFNRNVHGSGSHPGASPAATSSDKPGQAARIHDYVTAGRVKALIREAMREDLGPRGSDITSRLFIRATHRAEALMRARQPGVLCGAAILHTVAAMYDGRITCELLSGDSQSLQPGQTICRFAGPLRSLLSMERVALNFVTHLSGIATLTRRFVEAVASAHSPPPLICDTRKTIPGLRGLAKYAVACGGGHSHRMGLYDAVLIKDNHLAGVSPADLTDSLRTMIARARRTRPAPRFIEVEVDTLDQLERVLAAEPDMVLLDNMTPDAMRQAVALRDRVAPCVKLEASGGIMLGNAPDVAATGVDRMAIGALTHSAPALDVGLDIP